MKPLGAALRAPLLAAAGALVVAAFVDRTAQVPAADVARGTEEAFAAGLHPREIPPGGLPQRWTGPRAVIRFRDVPPGPCTLEVALRGHRGPVSVAFDGMLLGRLAPGQQRAAYAVPARTRGPHVVELQAEAFVAGDGRTLGALLQHVRLRHAPPSLPSAALLLEFALPAAVVAVAAVLAGASAPAAAIAGLLLAALQAVLLAPQGLLRSGLAPLLAGLVTAGAVLAAAFARWSERRWPGAGRWAFAALGAALLVQGVLASWPAMVVSDAVFHANNLMRVARGDLFITSVTQHARPFRFPYGVSFYAPLAPLARWGLDPVSLVRLGASVAAAAASLALFLLLVSRGTAARAGLAVLALQVLPVTLDVHSHGNLSNVFGQAATTGFFAWWAGSAPGGGLVGAALVAAAALGHFSSAVVLAGLGAALALTAGRGASRARLLALAIGGLAAAAYYAHFAPMLVGQVPRLMEGGGQGRGASRGAWAALRLQLLAPLAQWGPPAIVLAWIGRPRRASGAADPQGLDRSLMAFWMAGAALAVVGVVSPLEVRYLYALTIPLAAAVADGVLRMWSAGRTARWAVVALLAAQVALAAANALDALWRRYR